MKFIKLFALVSFLLLTATSGRTQVLIIQDTLPWSSSAIQDTLSLNAISYSQITSSQIGTTDLSLYKMVIMPSVQGNTYYTNWNNNISKIKDYVYNGGKLWQSTCNQSSTATEPQIPGEVVSSSDSNNYNDIVDQGHPWVQGVPNPITGSSANHDSFTYLYPGSTVIATARTSSRPVLVDFRYGAGRIFLSGLTLEFAWKSNWDAKPILENSLLELFNSVDDYLIIQDKHPWSSWIAGGITSIQDVLASNNIHFDQLSSSEISAADLSMYKMIIVPSLQGNTFYTNWNANIAKIETYVNNGGKLWQSTCNETSTTTEPLIPGGVVSSTDISFYNSIKLPSHPWVKGVPNPMYGNGASHDSFTNLYSGSKVISRSQTSGRPVLVDYHYGDGRVLITGQTLEFAWKYNYDGKQVLENSLIDLKNSTDDVLIIIDSFPWGSKAIHDTLSQHTISYDQITSSQIGTTNLSPYKMVIIPSVQGNSYYNNWNSNIGKIETYVSKGGKLWQSTCNYSGEVEPLIPGGVVSSSDSDTYNDIATQGHPWVKGVPNPMYGNDANHDSFTNLYKDSRIIAMTQTSKRPVLVEYNYGDGRILITGQTLEYAWKNNQDGKPIVENSLIDMYNPRKAFPWNLFLPAILMNQAKP